MLNRKPNGRPCWALEEAVESEGEPMYARLITLTVSPAEVALADRVSKILSAEMPLLPGFHSATFFCDPQFGEYAALSLWATKEDAVIGGRLLCARAEAAIAGSSIPLPASKLYEVYEPEGAA